MTDKVINLNVGGKQFATTKHTLQKDSNSILFNIASEDLNDLPQGVIQLDQDSFFIDRDGEVFGIILNFLRTDKLTFVDGFRDISRLLDEAAFYQLPSLTEQCQISLEQGGVLTKVSNGSSASLGDTGGYITIGYRGTFAFGRDGQADVKFRKLHRILVCGRVTLCREVFGDTLNESRDPAGPDDGERYTSRLYLKHQCLEKACDLMAEKGFKLVATCCSGANGLAAANHPVLTGSGGSGQSELINHRNCGDYEEQRWAHYTEYVFFREPTQPQPPISLTPSPRDII